MKKIHEKRIQYEIWDSNNKVPTVILLLYTFQSFFT